MDVSLSEQSKVWVVAPTHARRVVTKLPPDDRKEWCYLGSNVSLRERVAKDLGQASRVFIGDELVKIASEVKQPFIDWVTKIARQQKDRVNWWTSRLASKSPLQTDVFLLVCYSRLAHEWICASTNLRSRIVVVEDPWLRWVIKRRFENDPRVRFLGSSLAPCLARSAYCLVRIPLAAAFVVLNALYLLTRSRLLFLKEPPDLKGSKNPAVLIFTWIEEKSFSVPGKFQDTHTGRLEEILLKGGERVRRLTPLEIPRRLFRNLTGASSSIVVTPCHIRIFDVIASVCSWFRIKGLKRCSVFHNWDYRPLLYRELLFEWGSISFPGYHLWYRTMLRVAARIGPKVKCLVYPFENQPWEKLLCLAWREKAKHVQLIGYQHSRVPPFLLPYALSKDECEMLPLPDRIVTNGEATLELLRKAGFPDTRLVNGGALRYEYLYSSVKNATNPSGGSKHRRSEKWKTVLVTFPLSRPHCKGLLVDLLDEFKAPLFLDEAKKAPVHLSLKCHPWLPLKMFYREEVSLPSWISFTELPIETELARADLMLYVPSTTSWREAYVAGVPVLKYEVDLLDIDPPELFDGFSVYSCRKDTLRSSIRKLLENPPARTKPSPDLIRKIFGRVDEDLWTGIVQPAKKGSSVLRDLQP